jgi:LPXTG-motif cell wall-anchored protein
MRAKRNNTGNVFAYKNDAAKGTYSWWKKELEDPVYNQGITLEEAKEMYSYGKYKPYWLSTGWWKKNFDQAFSYWWNARIAAGKGVAKQEDTAILSAPDTAEEEVSYTKYIILGLLVVGLIVVFILKKKKKL